MGFTGSTSSTPTGPWPELPRRRCSAEWVSSTTTSLVFSPSRSVSVSSGGSSVKCWRSSPHGVAFSRWNESQRGEYQQSPVPNTFGVNKLWLSLPCKHGSREVGIIFCWLSLTSQSSLRHCRPDLLALPPAAGPQRCSEAPGGGTVDRWASRPSGEVWVGVVEDDEVPLALSALFSVWSANGVKCKS